MSHRLRDRSRLWTGVKELFFGRGGPYEKLAALPAANVRVSDIQHAVQPYISRLRATPGIWVEYMFLYRHSHVQGNLEDYVK